MSEIHVLKEFKNNLISFFDELIDQFPDIGELVMIRIFLKDQVIIKDVVESVSYQINKNDQLIRKIIKERNEEFFLEENNFFDGYWNPYDFMKLISGELQPGDVLVPSSSGAAETVAMQAAEIPSGVFVVTDKGMASMGYGLGGAIGAAFKTGSRVIHVEGDGGFAQNLQDLGTVSVNNLPLKIFIFDNGGYASIRMTQKSYFDGQIIGCDPNSGLGLPNWEKLFSAFGISCDRLAKTDVFSDDFLELIRDDKPRAFLVPIHPEQSYFPKITSTILPSGAMASNPLHLMTPDLSSEQIERFLPYLKDRIAK